MTSAPSDDPLSPQRRDSVAAILRLTHEMLELAQSGDWDRLMELESERKPLIEAFFAHPVEPDESPAVAAFIGEIQEVDAQVVELAEKGREATAEALRLLANRQRAADAYGAHRGRR